MKRSSKLLYVDNYSTLVIHVCATIWIFIDCSHVQIKILHDDKDDQENCVERNVNFATKQFSLDTFTT